MQQEFSREKYWLLQQKFSREKTAARIFQKKKCRSFPLENSCCVSWSEPYVPAAYSGVPFLTDVLAVPFFASSRRKPAAWGRTLRREIQPFCREKWSCHLRISRSRRGRRRMLLQIASLLTQTKALFLSHSLSLSLSFSLSFSRSLSTYNLNPFS